MFLDPMPLSYQMQLRRDPKSGLAAVLGLLSECSSLGWDSDRKRGEIAGQRTMEGIVSVINRGPPDSPDVTGKEDGAATEPS